MSTTLTLKNIPDAVYERLKAAAKQNRRSLNSEAILCLEQALVPGKLSPKDRLARARALRAGIESGSFQAQDIAAFRNEGRP